MGCHVGQRAEVRFVTRYSLQRKWPESDFLVGEAVVTSEGGSITTQKRHLVDKQSPHTISIIQRSQHGCQARVPCRLHQFRRSGSLASVPNLVAEGCFQSDLLAAVYFVDGEQHRLYSQQSFEINFVAFAVGTSAAHWKQTSNNEIARILHELDLRGSYKDDANSTDERDRINNARGGDRVFAHRGFRLPLFFAFSSIPFTWNRKCYQDKKTSSDTGEDPKARQNVTLNGRQMSKNTLNVPLNDLCPERVLPGKRYIEAIYERWLQIPLRPLARSELRGRCDQFVSCYMCGFDCARESID